MNKFRFFVFAAILLCMLGAQVASAQNIAAYQGSGQLICIGCNVQTLQGVNSVILQQFDPLYAKVTDGNGNPLANSSVLWSITTGGQYLSYGGTIFPNNVTTTTDSNGLTHITYIAPFTQASGNGPVQSTVQAMASSGATATFTLSQTSVNILNSPQLNLDINCAGSTAPSGCVGYPVSGTTISGNAGSTGTPIYVGIFAAGNSLAGGLTGPLAGVSIKLVNYQSGATVACATAAGADPGSGLSDSTGYAVCNPVFSGKGNGQFGILVGGAILTSATYLDGTPVPQAPPYVSVPYNNDSSQPQPTFAGYSVSSPINETVAPASVGSVQLFSGNNQTSNSGQVLAAPLVALVTSTAGNPITSQPVTWTVSPAGAATLSNTSTTTDANGHASTNVTLSSTASGTVTIRVTAGNISQNFTVTAQLPTQVSSLTKASGDAQTAPENTAFANPVVVQVSVSSGSVANQTVQFSVSGPATLSASTATTDSNGRAQVTVQAGATSGTVTVTASVGNITPVTFTLTVSPPGPQLTSGSFFNGADFQKGSISPCGIATIIASGLAPGISGIVSSNNLVGYLNYTVASDTVTVAGAQAPIYNVSNVNGSQQLTFQVPCSVTPGTSVPVVVTVGGGSNTVNTTVLPASPGVFQSQYNVNVQGFGSLPLAVVVKRDGTLVSPTNPARQNETVIAYVTGLGPTSPSVGTNALPIFGAAATTTGQVVVGINNSGVPVLFSQLSEDLIGISLVAFQIPSNAPQGNEVFSIGLIPTGSSTAYYSNPAAIYIQ